MTEAAVQERLEPLDVFRGVLALAIVVYHTTLRYPRFMAGLEMGGIAVVPGIMNLEDFSEPVVCCFFMLSGFVISWTVDRCTTAMDFVVSRVSRIYPAYWATILLVVGLRLAWPLRAEPLGVGDVLLNLTMLQSYLGGREVTGVFWSLGVEILFYLYVLMLLATGLWRRVHVVVFAWAVLLVAYPVLVRSGVAVPWRVVRLLLLEYGAFLAAGMMLYRLWRGVTPWWSGATLGLCGVAVVLGYRAMPVAVCFLFAGLMVWSGRGGLKFLAVAPLLWLGRISYALYLSHETFSYTVMRALGDWGVSRVAAVPVAIGLALLLATAITYGVERPAMRGLRGWLGRGAPNGEHPRRFPAAEA